MSRQNGFCIASGSGHVSGIDMASEISGSNQPLKIFNICDKNALPLREENNDPLLNLSLSHSRNDVGFLNVGPRQVRGHLQYIYQCSHNGGYVTPIGLTIADENERFAPPGWSFCRRSHEFSLMGYHCKICEEKFKSYEKLVALAVSHSQAKETLGLSSATLPSGIPTYHKLDVVAAASKGIAYEENPCILTLGRSSGKGKEPIVSAVGFHHGPEENYPNGNLNASNNFLALSLPSTEGSGARAENSTRLKSADQAKNFAPRETKKAVVKQKRQHARKISPYSFPTNVKNLLSTGIFEGVPVKYISWSRGHTLKGIIKGTNYLCACDRCKMMRKVNAYEFEQHAGCDTKHPNNHIYFPSGKSLYSVVQKLKGIQNDSLFDAIKTASGTPVNIKNFRAWKALYESASNSFRLNPLD